MRFNTVRYGATCTKCAEKYSKAKYEAVPKGVIVPVFGQLPKINWERFLAIDKGDREYHGGPLDQATYVLRELGVLVYSEVSDNCWQVSGCGMNLGPLSPGYGGMCFTRESDALEYARLKYAKAMYPVYVSHQGGVQVANR